MKKPKEARGADRWTQQVRFDLEFAKRMVLERGQCATILVVYPRRLPSFVFRPGDLGKRTAALYLRALCTAIDAEAFAFISEAWMRRVERRIGETGADHEARVHAVPASEAEDRIEIVMAQLTWRDADGARRTLSETRAMIRDAAGKVTGFRVVADALDRIEGQWVDVISPERPTAAERASASAALRALREVGVEMVDLEHLS